MQKIKEHLLKNIGDIDTVNTVMDVLQQHIITVSCDALVPDFEYKYGNDNMRQEYDKELVKQMVHQLTQELLNKDLIEVTEEYSYLEQSLIKHATLRIIKKDLSDPMRHTVRW